jgi:hypothetical protein
MLTLRTKIILLLVSSVVVLGTGCGANTSSKNAVPSAQRSAATPSAEQGLQLQDPTQPPQPSSARPSKTSDDSKALSSPKLTIRTLLPRPIMSEKDAQECLAAVREFDREIFQLTGQKSTSVTKRLKDCVIQYDPNNEGYTKFYPASARVRLNLRDAEVADVNVYLPDSQVAVIHVRIDNSLMLAHCRNVEGTQEVDAHLSRTSDTEPFSRLPGWEKLSDPELLEEFCMQAFNDFQQLRGN